MHEHTVRAQISTGTVEGFTRNGVHRWRSIPYAKPPVGALRYRTPVPAEPWPGVRYCHGFSYCAPQQKMYTLLGLGKYQPMSEDCLTLNVVAPEEPSGGPADEPARPLKPVMFFIHGGGYIMGSSATPVYDGVALARRGCVYVSVNYRLGALGCLDLSALSTPEYPIDSNLFLADLILALRWVRENIAVFGGDPENVTIFGESAGAHAVATLMAVPDTKGLFAQAISESPASGMVSPAEDAAVFAEQFAGLLGASRSDGAAAAMAARPADLVTALDKLIARGGRDLPGSTPAGPTSGTALLPQDPVQAMRTGRAHRVPLIVGTNADEGKLFTRFMKLLPTTEPAIEALLGGIDAATRERIIAAYPDYPAKRACVRFAGDFVFNTAAWDIAEAHSLHAPTYRYRYDYAPRILNWSGMGATHATELLAVFGVYRTRVGGLLTAAADQASARRVSREMQTRWGAFSRDGSPGEGWPRYDEDMRAVLVFDRNTHLEYDPDAHRRQAWEGFSLAAR